MSELSSDSVQIKIGTTADNKGIDESSASFLKLTGAVAAGQAAFALASEAIHKITSEASSVVSETEDWAKSTIKLQREMGVTSEAASGLLAVFTRFGIDVDGASKDLGIFAKQIEKVADPAKYAGSVFDDMGVKVLGNNGILRTADQILMDVADRFKEMPNGVGKTTEAMQLFGKSGKDMLPILNLGSAGIKDLEDKAKSMGLVLTQNNINSVRQLIVAQKDWHEQIEGIKIQLGLELIPKLTEMAKFIVDEVVPSVVRFVENLKPLYEHVVAIAEKIENYLAPKLKDLGKSIEDLKAPVEQFVKEYIIPLVKVIGPAVGEGLVWAIGEAITVMKDLLEAAKPVFEYLDKHKIVVELLVGAFAALKAAMLLQDAFAALKVGFITLQTVTIPGVIAELGALGTAFVAAIPTVAVAVAIAAIVASIYTIKGAWDAVSAAARSAQNLDNAQVEQQIRDLQKQATAARAAGDTKKAAQLANAIGALTGGRAQGGPVSPGGVYAVGDNPDGSWNSTTELFAPSQAGTIIPASKVQQMMTTNSKSITIGSIYLGTADAVREMFNQIDQDRLLISNGLTPRQGAY